MFIVHFSGRSICNRNDCICSLLYKERTECFDIFISVCLLDEPENSLSPEYQQQLVHFIEDSVRFFNCQFVIATHSPFLLSMKNSKIYNLDEMPMKVCSWTELPNVRAYHDFFKEHEQDFIDNVK